MDNGLLGAALPGADFDNYLPKVNAFYEALKAMSPDPTATPE